MGINDPWTWTVVWGLTVGVGGEAGWRKAKGENWNNCNRIRIKNKFKKEK